MLVLMHTMKCYACYGYKELVFCPGFKCCQINYYCLEILTNDFKTELQYKGFRITFAGVRRKRVERDAG